MWGGIPLFAIQVVIALSAWFHDTTRSLDAALVVFGEEEPLAGAATPLRLGVANRHNGRFEPSDEIGVELVGAAGTSERLTLRPSGSHRGLLQSTYVAPSEPFALRLFGPAIDTEGVRLELEPVQETDRSLGAGVYDARPSIRRPDLSGDEGDQPRVALARHADACPLVLDAVPSSGVAPRMIESRMWLRLTTAEGIPVSGRSIAIEPPEEGGPPPSRDRVVTDRLGLASFDFTPLAGERWDVTFTCDGGAVTREIIVTPSWDGMAISPAEPTYSADEAFRAEIVHQRGWGSWYLDVGCDNRLVLVEEYRVTEGRGAVAPRVTVRVAPGDVRLCRFQAYSIAFSPDPPRSVHHFLVRGDGVTPRDAVRALAQRAAASGELGEERGQRATFEALDAGSDDEVARMGQWLLSSIPQPFRPLPRLYDDTERALVAFADERVMLRQRLLWLLGLDAVILLAVVALIVIPSAVRQRRRLRAAYDELDAEGDGSTAMGLRDVVTVAVGLAIVAAFVLGVGVLLWLLRTV